jgi:hypothetical protein
MWCPEPLVVVWNPRKKLSARQLDLLLGLDSVKDKSNGVIDRYAVYLFAGSVPETHAL